jgi:hypothetical protein
LAISSKRKWSYRRFIGGTIGLKEVVGMPRYLLVLDMDLLAQDEQLDLEPINYLVARQQLEPCEVVVLSLANTSQVHLPAMELLLGARAGKFPVAPRAEHSIGAAAGHRMNLAVQHLTNIGCQASGIISDEDLLKAVTAETRANEYDEVILATSPQDGKGLAHAVHLDPIHQLQRRLGKRLIVFPLGSAAASSAS